MCRLFGLTAGTVQVKATFWLLDAPDSLQVQSHRNADGAGLGFFSPAGEPVLDKQPEPAFSDQEFIREARQAESSTFVAHVRLASTGGRTMQNTHPFAMDGRVMAHNGGFGELVQLEAELGSYARLVLGNTDSERYFALVTKETDARPRWSSLRSSSTVRAAGACSPPASSCLKTDAFAPMRWLRSCCV